MSSRLLFSGLALFASAMALLPVATARAADGFLSGIDSQVSVASMLGRNGDRAPLAVAVVPAEMGALKAGDVLVSDSGSANGLPGAGRTIAAYHPDTKTVSLFAELPRDLPGCPGGVGLSAAMAILKSGWVVVGSAPGRDGTTAGHDAGCLILLDATGKLAGTFASPNINMPWGNMAVIDHGTTATLFVSNAGFGVDSPAGEPPVVTQATVLRLDLAIDEGKPPAIRSETVIGHGFSARSDRDLFLIGPSGLAHSATGTLYVSDAIGNRIAAIDDAATRVESAGTGRVVSIDGLLQRPLAMAAAPNGHLLITNGRNGQVVEFDPVSERQVGAKWLDRDKAQNAPGSGDLFGLATTLAGDGFYFVENENNTLVLAE